MKSFDVGDIVEWNETDCSKTGLSYIKGIIKEDNGIKSISVFESKDKEKPSISYSLCKERSEVLKICQN